MTDDEIRKIVREEIASALTSLSLAAVRCDMPYDTDRADSNVYTLIAEVADKASRQYREEE